MFNTTCNTTLDDLRISKTSEVPMVGTLTFHNLGLYIAGGCAAFATILSFWLIMMHAINYTKPYEQRHIIRILFMVPVYSVASFLSFWFYWHAIYFQVISECYEAFAIASFFALLCHYIAPDLHNQKDYFRGIQPKKWVLPVNWMAKCCGGERGPWRTPRSGLTWFNIIWTGIYQYCFIRVTMTVTAVVTQYFGRYCESSNSPVFGHIWILVIEGVAVSIAMYCVIQFYIQLRVDLAPHRPFLKVLAIKLVIFLSFWQSFMISILTSATFNIVSPNAKIAYPDLKQGIPNLLLCIEMAIFAILHIFAFTYRPYRQGGNATDYASSPGLKNEPGPKQGGFLGVKALADAMNPWDLAKGFARGMRWLFVGRKNRENDASYKSNTFIDGNDMAMEPQSNLPSGYKRGPDSLPIAEEFRRSKFGLPGLGSKIDERDEGAGLIAHAQPNPLNPGSGYVPARQRYDSNGQDISADGYRYDPARSYESSPDRLAQINPTPGSMRRAEKAPRNEDIGMAISDPSEEYSSHVVQEPYTSNTASNAYLEQKRQERQGRSPTKPSEQWASSNKPTRPQELDSAPPMHNALWGAQNSAKPPPEDHREEQNRF